MNTTINRQTMVSKYNKEQQNIVNRDTNKITRYR